MYVSSSGRFEFPLRVEGKLRWIGCDGASNITEAREFKRKYLGQDEVEFVLPSRVTFLDVAREAFDAADWTGRTLETHEGNLKNYLKPIHGKHPGTIDANTFLKLVIMPMRRKSLSTNTVLSAIQTANIVYEHGIFTKRCPKNPVKDLRKQDRKGRETGHEARVISTEEFGRILAVTQDYNRNYFTGLHFRVCFSLFMMCGLRLGEAIGLQWGDIDFAAGTITINRQVVQTGRIDSPKTKASAGTVDLAPSLAAQLMELKRRIGVIDPTAHVLAGKDGRLMGRTTASSTLRKAAEAAGLDGELPSPHDLRHSFGSFLVSRCGHDGIDIAYVSKQMRHENVNITLMVYTHEWDKQQKPGRAGRVIDAEFGAALG